MIVLIVFVNIICVTFSLLNIDLRSYQESRKAALVNLGIGSLFTLFEDWDNYDDYHILYRNWILGATPNMADRWNQDRWFGYRFLNAANPVVVVRCDALPENFPVTNDDVKASLDRGKTLEEEMKVTAHQKYCITKTAKLSCAYYCKNVRLLLFQIIIITNFKTICCNFSQFRIVVIIIIKLFVIDLHCHTKFREKRGLLGPPPRKFLHF
jgi:hypothetical protein